MSKARERRIPIMFSLEELERIDDWRFENRIATRANAVRQLVERGLLSSKAETYPAYDANAIAAQRQWDAAVKEAAEAIALKRHGEATVPIHPMRVVK